MQLTIDALKQELGIDRLVLQVHDASFPMDPEEDTGRGTPYSQGADRFFRFAAALGFDGIQLGPRGMTGRGNSSPYDGTIFSRNPLDLPLWKFVEQGRIRRASFESLQESLSRNDAGRIPYSQAWDGFHSVQPEILDTASASDRAAAAKFLAANRCWLIADALYEALCDEHERDTWHHWGESEQGAFDQKLFRPPIGQESMAAERLADLQRRYAGRIRDYALIQWLLDVEQRQLRKRLADRNLTVYGDLQVGLSLRDVWARQQIFLPGYLVGAPPSRTNPSGQPWGYAVLDPRQLGTLEDPGPALMFVRERVGKMLAECDGLRIDHPHGWIDPWVYRDDDADPFHAVQNGARFFSSPNDPQHPGLHAFAIARSAQLNPSQPGYADQRVISLDENQVASYSLLFDTIRQLQAAAGRSRDSIACEILSTLPNQVRYVLQRHSLGRFRVTQKIRHDDPADVYRVEHAMPEDWMMLGTHDTPPIWQLAQNWCQSGESQAWGDYLSALLVPQADCAAAANRIAHNPGELVHALFTAMLGSQARNVVIFFPDLLGITERYNEPGVIADANWSLRVPSPFETLYKERCARGEALDVSRCLLAAVEVRRQRSR